MKPPAEEEEAAEERSEERDTSTARRRCYRPVLLPRWAKLYPGGAAMEYDDDNDGPGMVLLRLGGSSHGL